MQLRTEIWVAGFIRRVEVGGAFATVMARGDRDAGAVIVKVNLLDGRAKVFVQALGPHGDAVWMQPVGDETGGPEGEVDAYVERRRSRDRDLWVVEVEDRRGRSFLDDA